jgi:hypothetical protein
MEEMEGRLDGSAHRQLVKSAADAGFTMLRIWGGGIFEPDAFYDACDEFGVMVYVYFVVKRLERIFCKKREKEIKRERYIDTHTKRREREIEVDET